MHKSAESFFFFFKCWRHGNAWKRAHSWRVLVDEARTFRTHISTALIQAKWVYLLFPIDSIRSRTHFSITSQWTRFHSSFLFRRGDAMPMSVPFSTTPPTYISDSISLPHSLLYPINCLLILDCSECRKKNEKGTTTTKTNVEYASTLHSTHAGHLSGPPSTNKRENERKIQR